MSDIVLPIPEILEDVIKNEEDGKPIEEKSREMIYNNPLWNDHLRLIGNSIFLTYILSQERTHQNPDELVLRGIGTSLYNDCATAYILMLKGFCQISFMPQRHMLECSLLLEYFSENLSAVKQWQNFARKQRRRELSPPKVLDKLKKLHGIQEHQIEASYALLCEMDVHLTYEGIARMLGDQRGFLHLGPYPNATNLGNALKWLALISSYSTTQLVKAFGEDNLSTDHSFNEIYRKFNSYFSQWSQSPKRNFPTLAELRAEGFDL